MTAVKKGESKPAESLYEVIERFNGYAYVRVKPITGRTHQIRVHLSAVGHPCVADPLYSKSRELVIDGLKVLSRQALHAYKLKFHHPEKGEMEFIAPLQEDMERTLSLLRRG
jgi:23S rRNA pseudouridine1911/1915/1917 synthase